MTSKDSLGDVNNRLVAHGESFPVVTLKDGSKVQTGTIGALVQNIKLYDRIAAGEEIEGWFDAEGNWLCGLTINEA